MRDGTLAGVAIGAALAVGISVCAWEITRPDSASPSPSQDPSMPSGFRLEQVPVDGLYYNCVVYSNEGLSCDWDHPLIGPLNIPIPDRSAA